MIFYILFEIYVCSERKNNICIFLYIYIAAVGFGYNTLSFSKFCYFLNAFKKRFARWFVFGLENC